MRGWAAALLLGACAPAPEPPPSGRVMSINLCSDQLLLALLEPERIASVTWLARDPRYSAYAAEAARVPVNRGTAEEVAAARPALVLTGEFSAPATKRMLRTAGYRLIEIAPAHDFDGIRAALRQAGRAVGAAARAEALITAMDAELATIAKPETPPRLLAWNGDGAAPGAGTLLDAIVTAAGAINVAAERSGRTWARYDAEALIAADPQALLQVRSGVGRADLRAEAAAHPAVARRWSGATLAIDPALYGCGTPRAARAASDLARALR